MRPFHLYVILGIAVYLYFNYAAKLKTIVSPEDRAAQDYLGY
jgi:hypothetical protein